MLHKHISNAERALDIDAHHAAEALDIDRLDDSRLEQGPIVEADIAAPKPVQRRLEQGLRHGFIAQIALDHRAGSLELRARALSFSIEGAVSTSE